MDDFIDHEPTFDYFKSYYPIIESNAAKTPLSQSHVTA
jgi:hypothetical protein